jgi:hypothetical protein
MPDNPNTHPRQSDELRGIVEELRKQTDTYVGIFERKFFLRIAARLSRIADKGECERCKDLDAELKLVRKAYDATG